MKNFIEEKYKQSENDEFEAFEMINNYKYFEIIKYYLPIMQIFWKKKLQEMSHIIAQQDFIGKLF